jgi:hypothetical protein
MEERSYEGDLKLDLIDYIEIIEFSRIILICPRLGRISAGESSRTVPLSLSAVAASACDPQNSGPLRTAAGHYCIDRLNAFQITKLTTQ